MVYISLPVLGSLVWVIGWSLERRERAASGILSRQEMRAEVDAYIEEIRQMPPNVARAARGGFLSGAKEGLVDDVGPGSVLKWCGAGILVGGFWGPIPAILAAFVAGTFLRRKVQQYMRLNRILPVVQAFDERAGGDE